MNKDVVQIYNGIQPSHKKRWNTAIYDHMDGPWEYHAKQNKPDGKSQGTYDFTYVRYKTRGSQWTNKTNKANKQKLIDTDNSMVVTRGQGGQGRY